MAFPSAIESGANDTLTSTGLLLAARTFFLLLMAAGLGLTYVGWRPVAHDDTLWIT
jgi:hypothetical protein